MPGQERPDGRQEGDGLHADPELVDDLEEDQRQDDGLGVVDRVRHGQQAERPHRVDRDGRHGGMVPQIGLPGWANRHGRRRPRAGSTIGVDGATGEERHERDADGQQGRRQHGAEDDDDRDRRGRGRPRGAARVRTTCAASAQVVAERPVRARSGSARIGQRTSAVHHGATSPQAASVAKAQPVGPPLASPATTFHAQTTPRHHEPDADEQQTAAVRRAVRPAEVASRDGDAWSCRTIPRRGPEDARGRRAPGTARRRAPPSGQPIADEDQPRSTAAPHSEVGPDQPERIEVEVRQRAPGTARPPSSRPRAISP